MKEITIFGKEIIDANSIQQLQNCMLEDSIGVLTADAHKGYAHPIGGVIAYKDHISVSGVGWDIACGNKAVQTDIQLNQKFELNGVHISKVMDEVYKRISFGIGRPNNEPIDHPVLENIRLANFEPQRALLQLASSQLGTIGSGNHYVDIFIDPEFKVWIGVHFGSRGFGHKTAMGFIAMYQGLGFDGKGKEGSMDSKPILLTTNSYLGQDYLEAMKLAGEYAYAGRDTVVNKVLEILGNPNALKEVHNHHNFAWKETHFGDEYWVVRKGATPAFPNQEGFIGSNMRSYSVIVQGVESETAKNSLYSTVHGAGRVMSRTEAAGKKKWIKGEDGRKRPVRISAGKIDFENTKRIMIDNLIELRGGGSDESPECYKNLDEVLTYCQEAIQVKTILRPIGVAMAGDEQHDPYKD